MTETWIYNIATGHMDKGTFQLHMWIEAGTLLLPDVLTVWGNSLQALFDGTGPGITGIGDRVSTTVGIDEVKSYSFNGFTGKRDGFIRQSVTIAGSAAQPTGLQQMSYVVYFHGPSHEDRGRVRMFLPPFTNDTVEAGVPAGLTPDHVIDGVGAMLNTILDAGCHPGWFLSKKNEHRQFAAYSVPFRFGTLESRGIPAAESGGNPPVTYVTLP